MKNRIELSIQINTNPENVWSMLTKPELVKQYMFGSTVHSDWEEGSSIVYTLPIDGKDIVVVNGMIEEVEAPKKLHHTLFPTGSDIDDIRENYLEIIYTIEKHDGSCTLSIDQFGFETVANGKGRYEESISGWDQLLEKMKEVAESI